MRAEEAAEVSTKKKSLVPLFGVAFIVAIVSTGIFYGLFVGKLNSASTAPAAAGTIVIAVKAAPAGTVLKAEDLKEVPWAELPLPAGAVNKLAEAVGQTLVEPLAEHEMVTHKRLAAKGGGTVEGGSMGIPEGMRAVSLQVQDSAGVVAMLRPGHKVDVQVIATVPGQFNGEPQLRTMIENMQVLTVPKEVQMQRGGASIVTVLASPKEAAALGLADSTAKIRIALRNPIDIKKENLSAVGLGNIFRQGTVVYAASSGPAASAINAVKAPAASQNQVSLLVRVAGASAEAVRELQKQLEVQPWAGDALQVTAFRTDSALEGPLQHMELISTSRLMAGQRREAGAQWSLEDAGKTCGLKIQFTPSTPNGGKVLVRVHPEVTTPSGSGAGVNRRRVDTEIEVADGQSFVVHGFAGAEKLGMLWDRLFPGRRDGADAERELLVFVTPKVVRPVPAAGIPATD